MRQIFAVFIIVVVSAACMAAEKNLQQLQGRAQSANDKDCPKICMQAARATVNHSDDLFTAGNTDEAQKQMQLAFSFAERATMASVNTRRRQKDTEIDLRKLIQRVRDIRQSLSTDDRPPLDEGLKKLDELRTKLLEAMFGTPKKDMRQLKEKKR